MAAPATQRSILDPRLLAAAQRLALTARRLVAGTIAGRHASRRPGLAREFSQFRPYQPGDEPRHIDWKLFARSDRYYLREGEVDTRVAITLVLDATASMQHRGAAPDAPRKFALACSLAAALAYLAENQGDTLALQIVADGDVRSILTAHRRQPFQLIVQALAAAEPSGRWPADGSRLTQALRRAELEAASATDDTTSRITVVLTDGHEHGGEIRAALAPLRTRRHELLFLQFIARDEREFPYRGAVRLEEWETGRVIETEAAAVRAAFLAAAQRERDAWSRAWNGDRFDYLALMTDEPLELGLRAFLRRRAGR
ncbi:MAG: DUF58 domain-containing protein [Chloroflexi bacterium]|nr:DUF58 domain-containing protein [Chloroflexota bacterium]